MTASRRERGSALLEFVATSSLVTLVVGASLTLLYLHFARAWIEYATEQALYCLGEGQPVSRCRRDLRRRVGRVPFVVVDGVRLARRRESWAVNARWHVYAWPLGRRDFLLAKTLNRRRLLNRAGLRS